MFFFSKNEYKHIYERIEKENVSKRKQEECTGYSMSFLRLKSQWYGG